MVTAADVSATHPVHYHCYQRQVTLSRGDMSVVPGCHVIRGRYLAMVSTADVCQMPSPLRLLSETDDLVIVGTCLSCQDATSLETGDLAMCQLLISLPYTLTSTAIRDGLPCHDGMLCHQKLMTLTWCWHVSQVPKNYVKCFNCVKNTHTPKNRLIDLHTE